MKMDKITAAVCGAGLLAAFAAVPLVIHGEFARTAIGDLAPTVVIVATVLLAFRNTVESRGRTALFWALTTLAMAMRGLNLVSWVWFEVLRRQPMPDPYFGDIVLFLHVVPIMAAVLIGRIKDKDDEGTLSKMLNLGMLLVWWMVLYAFVVLPDEYVITDRAVYSVRWDRLYLIENLMLIALSGWAFRKAQGAWRKLHRTLLAANISYGVSSLIINVAIRQHTYRTGGFWDIPFLAALLCFLWLTIVGRGLLVELESQAGVAGETYSGANTEALAGKNGTAPMLARLALLSLPCMGYWALFISEAPERVRQVRFEVAIGGVAILIFFVFLKQHLLDRKLVQLLDESRRGYENLGRLQGRVIQQEKLASLGELVSLGARELQYPLSAILEGSEALAMSSQLNKDQLLTAKKIGLQARRTRDLVHDLLSFAQQVPGEKIPLELRPLLHRAVQMEGFKLENREIKLDIESEEHLPRVLGNGNQLLQAFLQIVENAAEALQGVPQGRLLISVRRDGEDVVVEFADNGAGLQNPERVFDPFYTTKPVGKGTGLGLSATYGVIQDHKGQISCHNRSEGGAVFEVRLPAIKGASAQKAAARGQA